MPSVAIATKHDKAPLIAPYLTKLGYEVVSTDRFDTDSLGTFAGEKTRKLSPKKAAYFKACKAIELTASDFGIGSEGSFGGGILPGLINWDEEILCMLNAKTGQAIYAVASMPVDIAPINISAGKAECECLSNMPGQHWIIRLEDGILKGLSHENVLQLMNSKQLPVPVLLEPDLRAMYCPSRQDVIAACAKDLARRLIALCPRCQSPDFVASQCLKGLPCSQCGTPTQQVKAVIRCCSSCRYQEFANVEKITAHPFDCHECNP